MNNALSTVYASSTYGNWNHLPFSEKAVDQALHCFDARNTSNTFYDSFASTARRVIDATLTLTSIGFPAIMVQRYSQTAPSSWSQFIKNPRAPAMRILGGSMLMHIVFDKCVRPFSTLLAKADCTPDEQLIKDLHSSISKAKNPNDRRMRIIKAHEYSLMVGVFCDHYPFCDFTSVSYEDNPLFQTYKGLSEQSSTQSISTYLTGKIQEAYDLGVYGEFAKVMLPYYSPTHQGGLDHFHPAGASCQKSDLENLELLDPSVRPSQKWIERVKMWCELIKQVKVGYLQQH